MTTTFVFLMVHEGKPILRLAMTLLVPILDDQSVICSVTCHVLLLFYWNLNRGGTKKVPGARYCTQWKTPQRWTVRSLTMQWKSAICFCHCVAICVAHHTQTADAPEPDPHRSWQLLHKSDPVSSAVWGLSYSFETSVKLCYTSLHTVNIVNVVIFVLNITQDIVCCCKTKSWDKLWQRSPVTDITDV